MGIHEVKLGQGEHTETKNTHRHAWHYLTLLESHAPHNLYRAPEQDPLREAMSEQEAWEAMAVQSPWPWPQTWPRPLRPHPLAPRSTPWAKLRNRSPPWSKLRNRSPHRAKLRNRSPHRARLGIWGPFWTGHETNRQQKKQVAWEWPPWHDRRSSLSLKNPNRQEKTDETN